MNTTTTEVAPSVKRQTPGSKLKQKSNLSVNVPQNCFMFSLQSFLFAWVFGNSSCFVTPGRGIVLALMLPTFFRCAWQRMKTETFYRKVLTLNAMNTVHANTLWQNAAACPDRGALNRNLLLRGESKLLLL